MNWLRRIVGDRRSAPATRSELEVLDLIVGDGDPRLRLVHQQLVRAPEIVRENRVPDECRVRPSSTYDDLTFPLEINRIESKPVRITDATSGRELEFRVVIGRHGFLTGLEGRTVDGGPWPVDWSIGGVQRPHDRPLITLPSATDAAAFQTSARERLAKWLDAAVDDHVEFTPPASSAALALREREIGGSLTDGYRAFLRITDGLARREMAIHGHRDAYPVNNPHVPALLVARDADDRDEFVVVVSLAADDDERVYRIDVHDETETPRPIATTFVEYLRGVVVPRSEVS